jgi:hypothetical protein
LHIELDEVALDLLLLSGMGSQELSQEHVQKMYITRQLEKEWQQFKHGVISDVINSRGIIPGFGKWQHHPRHP